MDKERERERERAETTITSRTTTIAATATAITLKVGSTCPINHSVVRYTLWQDTEWGGFSFSVLFSSFVPKVIGLYCYLFLESYSLKLTYLASQQK